MAVSACPSAEGVWGRWAPLLLQAGVPGCPSTGDPSQGVGSAVAGAELVECLCVVGTVWSHSFASSRKKKKILKEQRKQRERVELQMDLPGVSIADDGDTSMFSLKSIHRTPVGGEFLGTAG